MMRQNLMEAGGCIRAKLLTSWHLEITERQEETQARYTL
jgi:hypothetical protein